MPQPPAFTSSTGCWLNSDAYAVRYLLIPDSFTFNHKASAKWGQLQLELQHYTVLQSELDLQADDAPDRRRLMTALDVLNQRSSWPAPDCWASGELG